jgi:hypothetical protein
MSTLQLENIKNPDATGNALELAADGSLNIVSNISGNVLIAGSVGIGTNSPSLNSTYSPNLEIRNIGYTQMKVSSSASSAGIEFSPSSGHNWEVQANNSNDWFVYNRTTQEYALRINGDGYITNPNQPMFRVGHSSGGTVANDNPIIFAGTGNSTIYNPGGHYSTSTGRFTAPVAGFYHFDVVFRHDGSVATGIYTRIRPYKNGSHMEWDIGDNIKGAYSANQTYDAVEISFSTNLNANDYIDIRWGCANSNTVTISNSGFSGYLVG